MFYKNLSSSRWWSSCCSPRRPAKKMAAVWGLAFGFPCVLLCFLLGFYRLLIIANLLFTAGLVSTLFTAVLLVRSASGEAIICLYLDIFKKKVNKSRWWLELLLTSSACGGDGSCVGDCVRVSLRVALFSWVLQLVDNNLFIIWCGFTNHARKMFEGLWLNNTFAIRLI